MYSKELELTAPTISRQVGAYLKRKPRSESDQQNRKIFRGFQGQRAAFSNVLCIKQKGYVCVYMMVLFNQALYKIYVNENKNYYLHTYVLTITKTESLK